MVETSIVSHVIESPQRHSVADDLTTAIHRTKLEDVRRSPLRSKIAGLSGEMRDGRIGSSLRYA